MKKLVLVVAFILGMTATSQGQAQVDQVYDGKIVDGRPHDKVHTKLDIDFEGMSVKNVKPHGAVDVFKVVLDADTIYEYVGDKFRFAVTDDKWNYLELEVFVDFYEQMTFKGKYNGEAFHLEGEDFIFDNSKKYAKVNYRFH